MTRFFKAFFLDNILAKLFSLIITIGLVFFVHTKKDRFSMKTALAPLELKLPPQTTNITEIPKRIQIQLSGPWYLIQNLSPIKPIVLDLQHLPLGNTSYYLNTDMIPRQNGLQIVSVNPSVISLNIEEISEKKVPIIINLKGNPRKGFYIEEYQMEPNNITITGPKNLLNRLDYVETDEIRVHDISETMKKQVFINPKSLGSPWLKLKKNVPIDVIIQLKKEVEEKTFDEILAFDERDTEKKNAIKLRITASASERMLEALDPKSLEVRISEKNIDGTPKNVLIFPYLPKGISIIRTEPEYIIFQEENQ